MSIKFFTYISGICMLVCYQYPMYVDIVQTLIANIERIYNSQFAIATRRKELFVFAQIAQ